MVSARLGIRLMRIKQDHRASLHGCLTCICVLLIVTALNVASPRQSAGLGRPPGDTLMGAREAWAATFGNSRSVASIMASLQDARQLAPQVESVMMASAELPASVRVLSEKVKGPVATVTYRVYVDDHEVGFSVRRRQRSPNGGS